LLVVQHKKGQTELASKKKRKTVKATLARGIAGASLEVIQKKRTEKTEVRQAARDAALREMKERSKKLKETKAAKKADMAKTSKAPPPKQGKGKGGKR